MILDVLCCVALGAIIDYSLTTHATTYQLLATGSDNGLPEVDVLVRGEHERVVSLNSSIGPCPFE